MSESVPYDYEIWEQRHRPFIERLAPLLERRALEARDDGHSHKGYLVGAAGLAYGPDGQHHIVYGSNYKSLPGTVGPRVCAEDHMMQYALLKGYTEIPTFTVAAFPQKDDHSGGDLNGCVIPCIHCRRKFEESIHAGDLFRRQTVFTSLLLEERNGHVIVAKKETCTIEELLEDFPADVP